MTDYTKLVKQLRLSASEYESSIFDDEDKQIYADAAAAIEALQAQLPKRGEWIDAADEYDMQLRRHMYICSICGKHADSFVGGTEDWWTSRKPNYCPNCGAKMHGERKEGEG